MRVRALVIFILLVLLAIALKEREQCASPDDVWVMSDRAWVCVRKN
jgi:hypothetical protein